jgi:hypothetical protein
MTDNLKYFTVIGEKGTRHHLPALDADDAIEQFYAAIKRIVGHDRGSCAHCNADGIERPLDRRTVIRPLKVLDSTGQTVKVLTVADLIEIEKIQK